MSAPDNAPDGVVESGRGLDAVVIVLVETSHPGNIGAAARAMKTMGLGRLRLVNPSRYPSAEATERAAGADDVLYRAERRATLDEALEDVVWAVATSARARHLAWPMLTPEECAGEVVRRAGEGAVAVVFGRERTGLSNAELDRCQALVRIPTVPEFSSLNLAAAVQIMTYAIRAAAVAPSSFPSDPAPAGALAAPSELEGLYRHLERALEDIGYYDPQRPKLLLRRLRRLFGRARLERSELNILRGILRAAQEAAQRTQERD